MGKGYVPTHRDSCRKIHSYPTPCPCCSALVIYFECSCGSKVFLDPQTKGVHNYQNQEVSDSQPTQPTPSFKLVPPTSPQLSLNLEKKDIEEILGAFSNKYVASNAGQKDSDGKQISNLGFQKRFHRVDCPWAQKIKGKPRVFENKEDAIAAGYKPCGTCKARTPTGQLPFDS